MPPLTIIIPSRSEGQTLVDTLIALQPLRQRAVEIIVAESGKAADCESLCDRLLMVTSGRARQMNMAAAVASGEFLLFLHADTRLPADFDPDHLLLDEAIWGFFPVSLSGERLMFKIISRFINGRSRLSSVATGDQCLWVRRSLFLALGGFRDIPLMEDVALSKQLRRFGSPGIAGQPVCTSSRRWQQQGVWRTILLMWSLRLAYFLGLSPSRLARWYR